MKPRVLLLMWVIVHFSDPPEMSILPAVNGSVLPTLKEILENDTNVDFQIPDQGPDAEPMFEWVASGYGEPEDGAGVIVSESGAIMNKHEDDHGSGSDEDMADSDLNDGVGVNVNEMDVIMNEHEDDHGSGFDEDKADSDLEGGVGVNVNVTGAIPNKHKDDPLQSGRKKITDYLVLPSLEDIFKYVFMPVAMFESLGQVKPAFNDMSWDNESAEMYPAGGEDTLSGSLIPTPNSTSTIPFFVDYKSGHFGLRSWPRDLTEAYQEIERWLQEDVRKWWVDAWRNKALFRVMVTVAVSVSTVGALLLVAGLCASTCNMNNNPLGEDPEVIELEPCFPQEVVGEHQLEGCEEDTKTQEDMSVSVNLAGGDASV